MLWALAQPNVEHLPTSSILCLIPMRDLPPLTFWPLPRRNLPTTLPKSPTKVDRATDTEARWLSPANPATNFASIRVVVFPRNYHNWPISGPLAVEPGYDRRAGALLDANAESRGTEPATRPTNHQDQSRGAPKASLRDLLGRVGESQASTPLMSVSKTLAPFYREISDHEMATAFRVSKKRYNITTYLFDHMEEFEAYLDAYSVTDVAKCKVFPITLKENAGN